MELLKTKTFWAGVSALVTAAGGYFTGTIDLSAALQMAFTGLIGLFLRHGMMK